MRLRCKLRQLRGDRPLSEIAKATKINRGTLSLIELGRLLPKDEQIEPMEQAYGEPFECWYTRRANVVLEEDEAA